MLDPQVQIHIINLAWQWTKETLQPRPGPKTQETRLQARADGFDMAYKAILRTILTEKPGAFEPEPPVERPPL